MRKRLLSLLGQVVYERRWSVLAISLAITALSLLYIRDIPIDTSFLTMLDQNDPEVKLFKEATQEFGGSSKIVLALTGPDTDRVKQCATELEPLLEKTYGVRDVQARFPMEFIEDYGLLLAPEDELKKLPKLLEDNGAFLRTLFADPTLKTFMSGVNEQLRSEASKGGVGEIEEGVRFMDGLSALFKAAADYARDGKRIGSVGVDAAVSKAFLAGGGDNVPSQALGDGFLMSPDGEMLLIGLQTLTDAMQMEFGFEDYEAIRSTVSKTLEKYPDVKAGYAGLVPMGYEDAKFVVNRIMNLSTFTFVIMVIIFWYMSRSVWSFAFVGITLGMGIVWTFVVIKAVFGFANSMSLCFAIMMFGMGLDFAIHLMIRHNEGLNLGWDAKKAIHAAINGTGAGIITGALTTASAFFAMNVADFKGAHQLGTTTGAGIVSCLIIMMTVFPAMLAVAGDSKPGRVPPQESPHLAAWARFVARHPVPVLAVSAVLTLVGAYYTTRLEMVYDLEKIIARGIPSIALKDDLERKFGISLDYAMLLANSPDEARKLAAEARKDPIFIKVESITDFLPENQDAKLAIIADARSKMSGAEMGSVTDKVSVSDMASILSEAGQLDAVLADLKTIAELSDETALVASIDKLRGEIKNLVAAMASPSAVANLGNFQGLFGERLKRVHNILLNSGLKGAITLDVVPKEIKDQFVGAHGRYLVAAYAQGSLLLKDNIIKVIAAVRKITPNSTGIMQMLRMNVMQAQEDFPNIMIAVITVLMLLLFADFRSLRITLFAMLPTIVSALISLGVTFLAGKMLTVITLVAFPLIFGIGIDYAVHLLHRYRESGDVVEAVSKTGRALWYTSLTTILSFSILMLTNHNGLIGVGFIITIGITLCFITTVTIIPAAIAINNNKKTNNSNNGGER